MKIYARIQNGVVAELLETDGDIAQMFHPSLTWVECNSMVETGYIYANGEFAKPEPVESPSEVPLRVTRRQGRLALLEVGKLDEVEIGIDAMTDPTEKRAAQIEYEADTWERSNAFLQAMWAQLEGTEAQLDDLFVLAATK